MAGLALSFGVAACGDEADEVTVRRPRRASPRQRPCARRPSRRRSRPRSRRRPRAAPPRSRRPRRRLRRRRRRRRRPRRARRAGPMRATRCSGRCPRRGHADGLGHRVRPGQPRRYRGVGQIDGNFIAKYPNVTIDHAGFPFDGYRPDKIQAALAAKEGPDVSNMYINPPFFPGLWPLNGLLSEEQRSTMRLLADWEARTRRCASCPTRRTATSGCTTTSCSSRPASTPRPRRRRGRTCWPCDALKTAGITPLGAGFKDGYLGQ